MYRWATRRSAGREGIRKCRPIRSVIATKRFQPYGDDPTMRPVAQHIITPSTTRCAAGTIMSALPDPSLSTIRPPIEGDVEALTDVVKGKALYIGASSMHAWQVRQMLYVDDQHGYSLRVDCRTTTI